METPIGSAAEAAYENAGLDQDLGGGAVAGSLKAMRLGAIPDGTAGRLGSWALAVTNDANAVTEQK